MTHINHTSIIKSERGTKPNSPQNNKMSLTSVLNIIGNIYGWQNFCGWYLCYTDVLLFKHVISNQWSDDNNTYFRLHVPFVSSRFKYVNILYLSIMVYFSCKRRSLWHLKYRVNMVARKSMTTASLCAIPRDINN